LGEIVSKSGAGLGYRAGLRTSLVMEIIGWILIAVGIGRILLPKLSKLRFAARGGEVLPADVGNEPRE